MADPRIERLARLLVEYSVEVQGRNYVRIKGPAFSAPLLQETYRQCILKGANPRLEVELENIPYLFYKYAGDSQLAYVDPVDMFEVERYEKYIAVAPSGRYRPNTREFTSIEPSKLSKRERAFAKVNEVFYRRAAEGELRWVLTTYPSVGWAQEASMSLPEYEDFVYKACMVDMDDPVSAWRKVSRQQAKICRTLEKAKRLRIVGEDTDLKLSVEGRKWINCDGKMNMPDGEIFTTPLENSAEGDVRFTFPGIYTGKEVEDIHLTFRKGKVAKARASKGHELLTTLLKTDEGAKRIGELGIGTNRNITEFTKEIGFDEKLGGTIHIALGFCYPETGGKNKSGIHWDILKEMKKDGEIHADGELIYRKGEFTV